MAERGGSLEWWLVCATAYGFEWFQAQINVGVEGPHQEVFRATAVTGRWRAVARTQLLLSVMARGSSKGLSLLFSRSFINFKLI
jgi:hypothetical protein